MQIMINTARLAVLAVCGSIATSSIVGLVFGERNLAVAIVVTGIAVAVTMIAGATIHFLIRESRPTRN